MKRTCVDCGKVVEVKVGLGQGYFNTKGYHYQCKSCFKKANK